MKAIAQRSGKDDNAGIIKHMLLRKARDTFIEQRRAWLMKKLYT
jgi:hypothetical protein